MDSAADREGVKRVSGHLERAGISQIQGTLPLAIMSAVRAKQKTARNLAGYVD
jgi:hypothetical protein